MRLGVQIISFHIFRKGNFYGDKLVNKGHSVHGSVWSNELPLSI